MSGGSTTVNFVFDLTARCHGACSDGGDAMRDRVAALPLTLPPVSLLTDCAAGLCSSSGSACSNANVKAWLEAPVNTHWCLAVVTDIQQAVLSTGASQLRYHSPPSGILSHSVILSHRWPSSMMDSARQAVAAGTVPGFAYSGNFLWWDRDKGMDDQIFRNISLMLGSAFVILLMFLRLPWRWRCR